MIREFPSDLPKLGSRPYVQGGTIFNGIVAGCDAAFGPEWLVGARIASFKLEREATANGRIVVADEALAGVDANATFLATAGDRQLRGAFIDEGKPGRTEPYDEDSFYRIVELGEELGGKFVLPGGRPRVDFIKGIVGANKRLHQVTRSFSSPLERIQFLYLKGLDGECLRRSGEEMQVDITNLSAKEVDGEAWSINHVDVAAGDFRSAFRICYRAVVTARAPAFSPDVR